jgi:hypothetical protein
VKISDPGNAACLNCRSGRVRDEIEVKALRRQLDALTLRVDAVIASVPEIGLAQAEDLAKRCDYMDAACEIEGNEVNTADAGQFFLEGYNHARELWRKAGGR